MAARRLPEILNFATFRFFTLSLLALIILFIPYCVLLISYVISRTFRYILGIYLSIKHGYKIHFATGLDTIVIRDPKERQVIAQGFYVLKGKLDVQKITEKVREIVYVNKNGKQQLRIRRPNYYFKKFCGFYYWDYVKNFNIEDNIQVFHCDPPKNDIELNRIHGQICSSPISVNGKSTWCLLTFPLAKNFEGLKGEHYVIYLRVNHAVADGVSIIRMLSEHFLDKQADLVKFPKIALPSSFWLTIICLFYTPISVIKQMRLPEPNRLVGASISGVTLIGFSERVSLDRVKRIKNLTRTTINDVLMSCIAAALRWYFVSRKLPLPNIRVTIPISFHDMSEPFELKNACSFVTYTVPVHEDTPIKRLIKTNEKMRELKSDHTVLQHFFGLNYTFNYLPSFMTDLLLEWNQVTAVVSNIPGPQTKSTALGGDEVVRYAGIIPHSKKTGLGISLLSFDGVIQFALHADSILMPDQEIVDQMMNQCTQELFELENQLSG